MLNKDFFIQLSLRQPGWSINFYLWQTCRILPRCWNETGSSVKQILWIPSICRWEDFCAGFKMKNWEVNNTRREWSTTSALRHLGNVNDPLSFPMMHCGHLEFRSPRNSMSTTRLASSDVQRGKWSPSSLTVARQFHLKAPTKGVHWAADCAMQVV